MSAAVKEEASENVVESLQKQILEKRERERSAKEEESKKGVKDAVSEPEADEIHVRAPSDDSEKVGEGSEGEGRVDSADEEEEGSEEESSRIKFSKGKKVWEIDSEAEIEFTADKRQVKMSLRELRDAAAGGIAVRNRMRQLAEEKKALYEPYREFSVLSKEDPVGALQKMFKVIKKIDPESSFGEFIKGLSKQAQEIAAMGAEARKAYYLEKELKEKEEQLSHAEQRAVIEEMKTKLMDETGLPEERIFELGHLILEHPVLSETVKSEEDLMNRIAEFQEEIDMQKACHEALRKFDPQINAKDPLILELASILRKNPDFDEKDLEEIAGEVLGSVQKAKASQKLSKKARKWAPSGTMEHKKDSTPDFSKMSSFQALEWQIKNKKKQQQEKEQNQRK